MQVLVSKWGNSLGLRIPKEIARRVGLRAGARVELEASDDQIVVSVKRPSYSLEELLSEITPEAMHEAFDWGPEVGRETVE